MLGTASGDAEPGGRVVAGASTEGFVTPRSQQGLPTISEMVEGFPSSGLQLMTRVGDFFRVARTEVVQVPAVLQGTHATPPRTITSHTRDSPSGASGPMALGDGSLGSHTSSPPQLGAHGTPTSFAPPPGRDGPLLSADMLQRMQALEQRAPLLYAGMPERPQSRTDSSSLPQEAIQAEVARQLAGFDQRAQAQDLEIQRMRRQLEEAAQRERALREQVRREVAGTSSAPMAPTTPPADVPRPPLQDAQVHTPIAHQVHDAAAQAVEALRAPAQTAAAATSGLWSNFWSGLQGSQRLPSNATPPGRVGQPSSSTAGAQGDSTSSGPNPQFRAEIPGLGEIRASGSGFQSAAATSAPIPHAAAAQASTAPVAASVSPGGTQGPPTSGNTVLDAVLLGVQQLQTLQAQQLTSTKKVDAPETVKTGIIAFPKLAPPDPSGGSLEFQDWMQLIAGLMSDFSDSSQVWWSGVVQISKDAYDKWVVASPIERLTVEPDERSELTEGKWGRVNARACAMLLDALDPTVKSDIIARKANQAASQILFRLYTTYQPGGTGERNLVLSNLQNPHVVQDAVSGVSALRAWGRWYQRCIDFGMSLPDPMVLVGGLTSMTKPVISKEPEVSWRTEMVKSALQLHGRPPEEAVKSYHKHLLAEFETLAGAQVAKKGGSSNLALKAADASGDKAGKGSGAKGGGKGGGNGSTCKYFLSPKGCRFGSKCKSQHSMNELSRAERFKKCLNCGSEEHRAKDCKAGKAEPKAPDHKPSVQAATTSSSQSVVQATPVLNMETFMQQAVQALRQLEAHPPRSDAAPHAQPPQP